MNSIDKNNVRFDPKFRHADQGTVLGTFKLLAQMVSYTIKAATFFGAAYSLTEKQRKVAIIARQAPALQSVNEANDLLDPLLHKPTKGLRNLDR